jgi:mRNA interferase RelE/StbE
MNWSGNLAWQGKISETARKQIVKFDLQVQSAIVKFFKERIELGNDPRHIGKALKGDKGELWRYRVGDYCIICDIQDKVVTVLVLRVGHRREVYRR